MGVVASTRVSSSVATVATLITSFPGTSRGQKLLREPRLGQTAGEQREGGPPPLRGRPSPDPPTGRPEKGAGFGNGARSPPPGLGPFPQDLSEPFPRDVGCLLDRGCPPDRRRGGCPDEPPPAPACLSPGLRERREAAQMSRHLPQHVSAQDLASAGKLALMEVLCDFNGSFAQDRGYVVCRVRGAVMDEMRRLDPLSRYGRAQVRRVRKAASALEIELNRAPTNAEVAEATGLTESDVSRIDQLGIAAEALSSEALDRAGEGIRSIADPGAPSPADRAEECENASTIPGSPPAPVFKPVSRPAPLLLRWIDPPGNCRRPGSQCRAGPPASSRRRGPSSQRRLHP